MIRFFFYAALIIAAALLLLVWGDAIFRADVKRAAEPEFYTLCLCTVYDSTAQEGGQLDAHGCTLVAGVLAVHPDGQLHQYDWVWLDGEWCQVRDVTAKILDRHALDRFVPGCARNRKLWRKEWRWLVSRRDKPAGKVTPWGQKR